MVGAMKDLMARLRADPSPGTVRGPGSCSWVSLGAIIGLVVGLHVYAATAWAAMFELGVPAAVLGAAGGFLVGCSLTLARRRRRHGSA